MLCYDDSTVNIVVAITIAVAIVLSCRFLQGCVGERVCENCSVFLCAVTNSVGWRGVGEVPDSVPQWVHRCAAMKFVMFWFALCCSYAIDECFSLYY